MMPHTRPAAAPPRTPPHGSGAVGGNEQDVDLVESVVAAIRDRISSGQFPVGTWLRQEKLATELGISRMPVREALRRPPSVRDLSEVYEIRGVLEGHAAAAAAQLITSKQLARLRHAHEPFLQVIADLKDERDHHYEEHRPSWHEANSLFHGVIVEASGNRNLQQVIEGLPTGPGR